MNREGFECRSSFLSYDRSAILIFFPPFHSFPLFSMFAGGQVIYVGAQYRYNNVGSDVGLLYVSTNGGVSFKLSNFYNDLKQWSTVSTSSDGKILLACVYGGLCYKSLDYGVAMNELSNTGNAFWIASAMSGK